MNGSQVRILSCGPNFNIDIQESLTLKKITINLLTLCLLATPAFAYKAKASWYSCCKRTANGERFNPNGFTAAHKKYKFGTKLKVTYHNRFVVVRINDRGPFIRGRELDLARGAARVIGCHGVCVVDIQKF